MMRSLQVREAKAGFSALLEAAERGEPTTITRHGKEVALVVPVEAGRRLYPDERPNIIDYLATAPEQLEIRRDTTPTRSVDL